MQFVDNDFDYSVLWWSMQFDWSRELPWFGELLKEPIYFVQQKSEDAFVGYVAADCDEVLPSIEKVVTRCIPVNWWQPKLQKIGVCYIKGEGRGGDPTRDSQILKWIILSL